MRQFIYVILSGLFIQSVSAEFIIDNKEQVVNEKDIEILLETAPIKEQIKLLKNNEKLIKQLEQIYIKKAVSNEARKNGLDKDPENEVRIKAIVDNALFLVQLNELKKSNKKDYTNFAKQVYEVNKQDYKVNERIDAAHILVSTKNNSDAEALKKINDIRQELLSGKDFTEIALEKSDDKSVKKNKGQLGKFSRDALVKDFTDVAFSMKEGELSNPVKTRFGYHLIKLNKKIPAGYKTFEEVKSQIIHDLREKDWKLSREEYFKQLKKEFEMTINDEKLKSYIEKKIKELEGI